MTTIRVEAVGERVFRVRVSDAGGTTTHQVTVAPGDLERYGADAAEALVEESFRFLLEREPKESILRGFALAVIERYFPQYPGEIRRRLAERRGSA